MSSSFRKTAMRIGIIVLAAAVFTPLTLSARERKDRPSRQESKPSGEDIKLSGNQLIDALREGGYTIYFRHAETLIAQKDNVTVEGDWTSCDPNRMRQLSEGGREQARLLGDAVRRLGIPVGLVLSSEYCRAKQTAELMNLGPVSTTRALISIKASSFAGGLESLVERARAEIGRVPEDGTNTVLVAHDDLLQEAAGGTSVPEGGAAVFAPKGDGSFALVAQVTPEGLVKLAEEFGR